MNMVMRVATVVVALLVCSACATPGTTLNKRTGTASLRDELTAREQELIDAGRRHDDAVLERILGPEFRLTGPAGPAVPRDRWLANLASMTWDSYELSDVEVFVWGNVAVVNARHLIENWRLGDRVSPRMKASVTDTWVKRGTLWQLVQRVSERLPEQ